MRQTVLAAVPFLLPLSLLACGQDDAAPASGSSYDAPASTPATTSAGLASAAADVERLAVRLESFYRGGDYPRDVETARETLGPAGLTLSEGNTIATYVYDEDAVEFALCVEAPDGAWATYDTAPMSVREAGESGGCPRS